MVMQKLEWLIVVVGARIDNVDVIFVDSCEKSYIDVRKKKKMFENDSNWLRAYKM